ncbi:DUF2252 family protein [bacterium]|nr:DUF2252 family protein [bacterium]
MKIQSQPSLARPLRTPTAAPPTEPSRDGLVGSVEAVPTRPGVAPPVVLPQQLARDQQELALSLARCAGTNLPGGLARSPQEGVDFVNQFNSELELPQDVLLRRNQLTVSSPSRFFRVNPALFYKDVMGCYFEMSNLLDRKAPEIIIGGDCHLGNLGTMRAPDGTCFWGINDFDMAGRGSPEDDLERMATSLMLMGLGRLKPAEADQLVAGMAGAYLQELSRLAHSDSAPLCGIRANEARGEVAELIARQAQARQEDLLEKFTHHHHQKLKRNEELRDVEEPEASHLRAFLQHYDQDQGPTPDLKRPLEVLDIARKMESGGSTYGLNRYFILVSGHGQHPRILELKQELPTAPEQSTGDLEQANAEHIFTGMAALGGIFDPTMAYCTIDGDAYYMRERQREKGSLEPDKFASLQQWRDLSEQAAVALARAHAHQSGVAHAICDWVGGDQDLLISRLQHFARVYTEQTVQDCAAYRIANKLA